MSLERIQAVPSPEDQLENQRLISAASEEESHEENHSDPSSKSLKLLTRIPLGRGSLLDQEVLNHRKELSQKSRYINMLKIELAKRGSDVPLKIEIEDEEKMLRGWVLQLMR